MVAIAAAAATAATGSGGKAQPERHGSRQSRFVGTQVPSQPEAAAELPAEAGRRQHGGGGGGAGADPEPDAVGARDFVEQQAQERGLRGADARGDAHGVVAEAGQ